MPCCLSLAVPYCLAYCVDPKSRFCRGSPDWGANILNSLTQTIRFAEEISVCNGTSITFRPLVGNDITYSCTGTNIASGSANLNSSQVALSACAISCPLTTGITDFRKAKYVDLSLH